MFGRKKRHPGYRIILRGEGGAIVQSADSQDYVIPEAGVVRLSTEFFNDPEPCEIHRAAVRSRALQQLQESCAPGKAYALDALDPLLLPLFPEGVLSVELREEPV